MSSELGLSRRAALLTVASITGTLYGRLTPSAQGRRTLVLALDDVEAIVVQYHGQRVTLPPAALVDALGGKEAT